jgi:phosphoesterase RecJ-like protein
MPANKPITGTRVKMTLANNLQEIVEALQLGQRFVVLTHIHPDGDAIGSQLAMQLLLKGMGKEHVVCVGEEGAPAIYRWMPGALEIIHPDTLTAPYDTIVIVDVSQKDRIGLGQGLIKQGVRVIIVDHHLERKPFGDVNFIDPSYAATGEIMVELFEISGVSLGPEAAVCAYVALATDTGGFRFENTTPRSHRMAAACVEKGVKVAEVSGLIFETMPLPKFRLLNRILPRVTLAVSGKVAHTKVTRQDLAEVGAKTEDIDGLITFARNIAGVRVAVLLRESDNGVTKVSMRARSGFNAAEFLKQYGGGGHAGAAGATLSMSLDDAESAILNALHIQLGDSQ